MRLSATARAPALLLALALTACTSVQLPAGTASLDPIAFFSGVSEGAGSLDTLIAPPVTVTVASLGFPEHGGLKLIQRIREGDKPERVRAWTMRRAGPGRYTGTLTDARGPVTIAVDGPRAEVRYRTPSGLRIQQQLALQPDGRTILNRLEAYKFGIRVAVLDETIRK
nr:DUF3833 family protein [uncultured Sphingomonas sp.]